MIYLDILQPSWYLLWGKPTTNWALEVTTEDWEPKTKCETPGIADFEEGLDLLQHPGAVMVDIWFTYLGDTPQKTNMND